LKTNRDLYRAIGELVERRKSSDRTLEQYLRALLGLARQYHDDNADALSVSDFHRLLSEAFTADPIDFEPRWREECRSLDTSQPAFVGCEAALIQQIVDLREMDEAGILSNEYRYFGIDAPRGARWYNFAPTIYLECAAAGSIGGWEPGDPTSRDYVPGEVAVFDDEGNIHSADPQSIERPIVEIPHITWEQVQDFLWCGQSYE
jgi:hypothetical protein